MCARLGVLVFLAVRGSLLFLLAALAGFSKALRMLYAVCSRESGPAPACAVVGATVGASFVFAQKASLEPNPPNENNKNDRFRLTFLAHP